MQTTQPPLETTLILYGVIALLLIWRYSRPMRMSVTRMWIGPIFLLAMTGLAIWASQRIDPVPAFSIAVALVIGFALGVPLGVLRGMHTKVRATDRPGVMYLDASWVVVAIWLGAFFLRAGLRYWLAQGTLAATIGDGLIAFAMGAVAVSYYVIYRKYRALEHQAGQI